MTNATFFELQRARVQRITEQLATDLQRNQFHRAHGDHLDTSPEPYHARSGKPSDSVQGGYMRSRMRFD